MLFRFVFFSRFGLAVPSSTQYYRALSQGSHSIAEHSNFDSKRSVLIETLRALGINNDNVLKAMDNVPRQEFLPPDTPYLEYSYENHPLPIGHGQTISQPWMVAEMCQLAEIKDTDKVLEIGAGCGYNAAVMSQMSKEVYSVEIIPELYNMAKHNIKKLEYDNIAVCLTDGSVGLPEHAPYDVIMVTAGAPSIPKQLKEQLAVGGRMIIPVYNPQRGHDELLRMVRTGTEADDYKTEYITAVRFVPLTGVEGRKDYKDPVGTTTIPDGSGEQESSDSDQLWRQFFGTKTMSGSEKDEEKKE